MSEASGSLLWFRQDLRLADNPALLAAVRRGGPVIPVFIWSPEEEGRWQPGAASRWWLHQSLAQLDASLRQRGSRLIIRRGPTLEAIRELLDQSGATAVYWNRRYEPTVIGRDSRVKAALQSGWADRRRALTAACFSSHGQCELKKVSLIKCSRRSGKPVWRSRSPPRRRTRLLTSELRDTGRPRSN